MPSNRVPTYALYGEFLSRPQPDAIHHETISERSKPLGWDIRLHRHEHLAQIFMFRTPGVRVRLGGPPLHTQEPVFLYVPQMVTHGFRFPADMQGDVLTLPLAQLSPAARERHARLSATGARLITQSDTPHFQALGHTTQHIAQAFRAFDPGRDALLRHLTEILLIYLDSGQMALPPAQRDTDDLTRHEHQSQAFCRLIEQHFAQDVGITWYAEALGVSTPHLTRISKRILGATPNALITRRRMIEAERLLKFTRHSITDIALRAGYHDAPYFNRVFKRQHGMAPGLYRKMSGALEGKMD